MQHCTIACNPFGAIRYTTTRDNYGWLGFRVSCSETTLLPLPNPLVPAIEWPVLAVLVTYANKLTNSSLLPPVSPNYHSITNWRVPKAAPLIPTTTRVSNTDYRYDYLNAFSWVLALMKWWHYWDSSERSNPPLWDNWLRPPLVQQTHGSKGRPVKTITAMECYATRGRAEVQAQTYRRGLKAHFDESCGGTPP